MSDPLERLLDEPVVLDTATPIVYIGRLVEITDQVFVLRDVDIHDCRDGHANKERYLAEAYTEGVPINRRHLVVMRPFVTSVSRLAEVVIEQEMRIEPSERWSAEARPS